MKHYKKKKKSKINFGSVLAILSVVLLISGVISGFSAVFSAKKKVDENSANKINQEYNLISEGKSTVDTKVEKEVEKEYIIPDIDKIFNEPLGESKEKKADYFDQVTFLGDSITEGLKMYGGGNPFIVSEVGVSTSNSITKIHERYGGKTLVEALTEHGSKYIYLMLGSNEVGGVEHEMFIKNYENLVNEIKINNPNSIIFIQSITPVTKAYDERDNLLTNKGIVEVNELLKKMAKKHNLLFVDVYQSIVNEEGYLDEEASPNDGVHFAQDSFDKWQKYLLSHTIPEIMEEEIILKQQVIIEVK